MKKFLVFCLSFMIILPCAFLFASCGKAEPRLSLLSDIQNVYYLNEALDLKDAKLKYIYDDGRKVEISVDESMISEFSTKKCGEKTMKLTYKDQSIDINYTVLDLEQSKYVCEKYFEGQIDKPLEQSTTYEFNRDNTVKITFADESVVIGGYSLLDNGTIQLTYNVIENKVASTKMINFVRQTYSRYMSQTKIDNKILILEKVA